MSSPSSSESSSTNRPSPFAKPEGYDDLDFVGYLYNACYGGFSFSSMFVHRMNERLKAAGSEKKFSEYTNDRTDPMAIELFQELGADVSSGRFAALRIAWVPREFLEYVDLHEYDGVESVRILFDEMDSLLLKNFLSDWNRNPSLTVEDLNDRYLTMREKVVRYKEYQEEKHLRKLSY